MWGDALFSLLFAVLSLAMFVEAQALPGLAVPPMQTPRSGGLNGFFERGKSCPTKK